MHAELVVAVKGRAEAESSGLKVMDIMMLGKRTGRIFSLASDSSKNAIDVGEAWNVWLLRASGDADDPTWPLRAGLNVSF